MMRGGIRAGLACALAAIACAGVTACGGDGDASESDGREKLEIGAAQEPADVFAKRMARLLATTKREKDCPTIDSVNARSFTRFQCPAPRDLAVSMADFKLVGHEEFGTGAVVDYRSAKADGAAILLFVAPDRHWGISRFGIVTEPSVGSSDADAKDGYEQAVADYLAAIREADCELFVDTAFLGEQTRAQICEYLRDGARGTQERLTKNADAAPVYEGGTDTFGFFSLETKKPRPRASTISVMRVGSKYVVLDMAPSPTKAEVRDVIRQYREQQKNGGSMTPSEEENTGKKAE